MRNSKVLRIVIDLFLVVGFCSVHQCRSSNLISNSDATLQVNASSGSVRKIPDTLFGVFLEEINNAVAGGLWAELVSNRGFEANGSAPWGVVGDSASVTISTDQTSCFKQNKVALKMEVLCDNCTEGGVGIYNPGFWGMNIENGKKYKLILYAISSIPTNITVSLTDASGSTSLASATILSSASNFTKHEVELIATGTNDTAKLQLTAKNKATIWFDQVSLMPMDTFKGHGFRKDLAEMIAALKPGFLRFPGGCYVEGRVLLNSYSWKNTVGPWEERPGHYGDVWKYWSDDGLGYFEYLQLAEDLDATPVWVFNSGISHTESVGPQSLDPYVQDALDGLEFAMGSITSKWGSVRASMGHPNPFKIQYVGIGNEDCSLPYYNENYKKFYDALKKNYPDVKLISNCDGSSATLPNPADIYDYHIYTDAKSMFGMAHKFDTALRAGPKAFVSEYAVTGTDAKTGTLLAALGEAAFLIGLENNSDLVEMAAYAPLLTNVNNRNWNPDAIAFNSSHSYGTPSYHMQKFFINSNGALLLNSTLKSKGQNLIANAIKWNDGKTAFLRVKVVNFDDTPVKLVIRINNADPKDLKMSQTVLTTVNIKDENSLEEPLKIVPKEESKKMEDKENILLEIAPHSITSIDFVMGKVDRKEEDMRVNSLAEDYY